MASTRTNLGTWVASTLPRDLLQSYIPHLDTITRLDNRPFLIAQSTVRYENYHKMFVKFTRMVEWPLSILRWHH